MNLPQWVLEIIIATLGVPSAEIPQIPIVTASEATVNRECNSQGAVACFVAEDGAATVYVARSHRRDLSLIAHEYTHAVQWHAGMFNEFECQRASEVAAYTVQNEVTKIIARREGERNPHIADEKMIAAMSECQ